MNRSIVLLIVCLLFLGQSLSAQRLSDQAKVSLLTIAPTNELYNQFGHTAVRIADPLTGVDYCYNYGVYDFDTPNFYTKFVRGRLPYMMSLVPTERELLPYQRRGRGVLEQDFNLSADEVRKVYAFLKENYQPENRYYLYDFFFDNCATRIRDLFEDALDTRFDYPPGTIPNYKTYRQLLEEKIAPNPWHDFGIDFILGSPTDRYADFRGEMFLPDYLAKNISLVKYKGEELLGPPRVLVANEIVIGNDSFFTPLNIGLLLLFMALAISIWGTARAKNIFDGIFYFLLAFCGFFLLFMRYGTDHFVTWQNYNILWANPLYLFAFLHVFYSKRWMRFLMWVLLALAAINLLLYNDFIQDFHRAILPLIGVAVLRLMDNLAIWRARPSSKKKTATATELRPPQPTDLP